MVRATYSDRLVDDSEIKQLRPSHYLLRGESPAFPYRDADGHINIHLLRSSMEQAQASSLSVSDNAVYMKLKAWLRHAERWQSAARGVVEAQQLPVVDTAESDCEDPEEVAMPAAIDTALGVTEEAAGTGTAWSANATSASVAWSVEEQHTKKIRLALKRELGDDDGGLKSHCAQIEPVLQRMDELASKEEDAEADDSKVADATEKRQGPIRKIMSAAGVAQRKRASAAAAAARVACRPPKPNCPRCAGTSKVKGGWGVICAAHPLPEYLYACLDCNHTWHQPRHTLSEKEKGSYLMVQHHEEEAQAPEAQIETQWFDAHFKVLENDDGTRLGTRDIYKTLTSHGYPHHEKRLGIWLQKYFRVNRVDGIFGHMSVRQESRGKAWLWVCIARNDSPGGFPGRQPRATPDPLDPQDAGAA
jgi:transposase-like protein